MAPLAHTLALLAMAVVATRAIRRMPLNKAQDSFDDQYQGCGPAMTAALPALMSSEFQKNRVFAQFWPKAVTEWQRRGSHVSPLPSPDHAIALMAFTMGVDGQFNIAMLEAGRSPQHYRDNFHYKSLHFLLTDALATLRVPLKGQCLEVFHQNCEVVFEAKPGDTVRFGQFLPTFLDRPTPKCSEGTVFQVLTCHGAYIGFFSDNRRNWEVLIPPFETFKVTEYTQEGNKAQIQLRSDKNDSKYNCEWLQGGSIPQAHFHLGGLLLATTALTVATGIL